MRRLILLSPLFILLSFIVSTTRGQEQTSALINQALDEVLSLNFVDTPLPDAIQEITEQTGVRIQVQPIVWELLPWGQETTITTHELENRSLRTVLHSIAQGAGLQWAVQEEAIELQPMPALRRLGRRAARDELRQLVLLATNPANLNTDRPTVRQVIEAVDRRLIELESPFVIEYRAGDVVQESEEVFVPRNATLLAAMESLVSDTAATWYPWGQSAVVASKQDQVRRQLDQRIDRKFEAADVGQVLVELSERSGVRFIIEPGAIQRVPAAARRIDAELVNARIRQVLETIAGITGLGYTIRDDGVYIWNQQAADAPAAQRDPVIAIVPIPELNIQLPLTESQISPELREYLEQKRQEELQKLDDLRQEEQSQRNAT